MLPLTVSGARHTGGVPMASLSTREGASDEHEDPDPPRVVYHVPSIHRSPQRPRRGEFARARKARVRYLQRWRTEAISDWTLIARSPG